MGQNNTFFTHFSLVTQTSLYIQMPCHEIAVYFVTPLVLCYYWSLDIKGIGL